MDKVVTVNRADLKSYLMAFRKDSGRKPREIAERLVTHFKNAATSSGRTRLHAIVERWGLNAVKELEKGHGNPVGLNLSDFKVLGDAYGISYLMLLPLAASTSNSNRLLLREDHFEEYPFDHFKNDTGAIYRIPSERLSGVCDTAIVRVDLPPGTSSETHSHGGDELLIVLKGEVEVQLWGTGCWNRVSERSFVNFCARQRHCVVNRSHVAKASLLVIRFYQLEVTNVRWALLNELRKSLRVKRTNTAIQRAIAELEARLEPTTEPESSGNIVDPFGFGRLLKLLMTKEFRGSNALTVRGLAKKVKENNRQDQREFNNQTKILRVHEGLVRLNRKDFKAISDLYEVSPILFYDFLFPAVYDAVTIRIPGDLQKVEACPPPGCKANYLVPCRHLADSNVAIAVLNLEPDGYTPENRHPGFEMLIPLAGNLRLTAEGGPLDINSESIVLAHYESKHDHAVTNVGDGPAEALVVRFYQ